MRRHSAEGPAIAADLADDDRDSATPPRTRVGKLGRAYSTPKSKSMSEMRVRVEYDGDLDNVDALLANGMMSPGGTVDGKVITLSPLRQVSG